MLTSSHRITIPATVPAAHMAAETPKGKAKAGPPGPPAALPLVPPKAFGSPAEAAPLGPLAALPLVPPARKPPPPAHLLLPQAPVGTKMQPWMRPAPAFPIIDLDQFGDAVGGDEEGASAKPRPPKRKAPPPNLLLPASSSDSEAEYACPPKASETVAMVSVSQIEEGSQHGASASSASLALDLHDPNIDPRDPNIEASMSAALLATEDARRVEEGEKEDAQEMKRC